MNNNTVEHLEMLDSFGIPEHFTTHVGSIEDAGDGLVRTIHCIKRNNLLVPVFSSVRPIASGLCAISIFRDFCENLLRQGNTLAH